MSIKERLGNNETGATAVYAAVVLLVLLMFGALGVDVNYLYGVRNELQNAADAGALAGASMLFDSKGELTPDLAIDEAYRVATANKTGKEVIFVDKGKNIKIGHWSFASKSFDSTAAADLINAVQVQTIRSDTPSFFAKTLGFADFFVSTDAVAIIGYAGNLNINDLDQPIAICEDSILHDGKYDEDVCNMARMSNDGSSSGTKETAMWTDFSQDQDDPDVPEQDSCDTANTNTMKTITSNCSGNPYPLKIGLGIGTTNGVENPTFNNIIDCWHNGVDADGNSIDTTGPDGVPDGIPDQPWPLTLPVVDCESSNTCATLVGAVVVNVIWMHKSPDPWHNIKSDEMVPTQMGDWGPCNTGGTPEGRQACWRSFVDFFKLRNLDMNKDYTLTETDYETMYEQLKNIYFLPSCEPFTPTGGTGGKDFNIRADRPVLVE
jgi:hypothetical protein